jgi:hypothetical protein
MRVGGLLTLTALVLISLLLSPMWVGTAEGGDVNPGKVDLTNNYRPGERPPLRTWPQWLFSALTGFGIMVCAGIALAYIFS